MPSRMRRLRPQESETFWVSGCYGDSPFRTDNGGKTFQRLGNLAIPVELH